MLTRRQLLQSGAIGGAGLMVPWALKTSVAGAAPGLKSYVTDLAPYFPPVASAVESGTDPMTGAPWARYALSLKQRGVRMHRDLTGVKAWSYLGDPASPPATYLGPTLVVPKGQKTVVDYQGAFGDAPHLFSASIDKEVLDPYAVNPEPPAPEMRFMTHLHGAFVDGPSDGNPFATHYTNGDHVHHEWGPNETQSAEYPAQDRAAFLWYHQHAHGITHLNVMAGLAGAYLVADKYDPVVPDVAGGSVATSPRTGVKFPAGPYLLPLVFQDRAFADGQLAYPTGQWVPEFFGDTTLVNGAIEPFLRVEARRYRFKLLNGSNARFYNLSFGTGAGGAVPEIWVIGNEGGLLPKPVQVASLVLAPGERADVVVDFGNFAGAKSDRVLLRNTALPVGIVSPAPPLTTVMEFRVVPETSKDESSKPSMIPALTDETWQGSLANGSASNTRTMILEEVMGAAGPLASIVNYRSFEGRPVPPSVWMDPANAPRYPFDKDPAKAQQLEDTIANGSTEEWQFVNTTADTHPMHLHLVQFGLVKREPLDTVAYMTDLMVLHEFGDDVAAAKSSGRLSTKATWDGNRLLPANYILPGVDTVPIAPEESGWKDTIRANPGEVTTIRAKFDLKDLPGTHQDYVAHCHILEHESNSMMRAYRVTR